MSGKIKGLLTPPKRSGQAVYADYKGMMPGMLTEQAASLLLDNVNVFIMGLIGRVAMAGASQISTLNNTLMIFFQFFGVLMR